MKTKSSKDLLLAVILLLVGYFFGDTVARLNREFDLNIQPEKIARKIIFPDSVKKNDKIKGDLNLEEKNRDLKRGRVRYVIDGDTVILENGEKIRYIGIDSPERGDCWYRQATDFNRRLVEGKEIKLEVDQSNRDRYQRLLRYVYQGDDFVNLKLVEAGLARVKKYKPDTKYYELLKEAEEKARKRKVGLWGGCEL